tara:strand:+ start:342 stop:551 length:210 start_codon:yes stop_codon:yes gene_type:complete
MKVYYNENNTHNETIRDLFRAKAHLMEAQSILSRRKIELSLGENLSYELNKELSNLTAAMDICMEITEG